MPDTSTLIIAHRGASAEAPENTLAAFRLAWQQGADGIEADFRLTRDGRVICLHDPDTGRTAGIDLIVAAAAFDDLRCLDVGGWKGPGWQGERIPSLEEILAELPPDKKLFIEVKSGAEIIAPLAASLTESRVPAHQLRLLTFDPRLVAELKERLPGLKGCLNVDYHWSVGRLAWSPSREELLTTLAGCGADGLSSKAHAILDSQFVAALHRAGQEVHVWTVDTVRRADHFAGSGVDSIMTNRPALLKSARRSPDREEAHG